MFYIRMLKKFQERFDFGQLSLSLILIQGIVFLWRGSVKFKFSSKAEVHLFDLFQWID